MIKTLVDGQVIRTTPEHPFWVDGQGWTAAAKLQTGDRLRSHDGAHIAVKDCIKTGRIEKVYNLKVEGYHTYFVGSSHWSFSVWAHNASCPVADTPQAKANYEAIFGSGSVKNFRGEPVRTPDGHAMSPRDLPFSAKPQVDPGPFTAAQRCEFLKGNAGGTKLSPHHRHQIPTTHGGVIDELPGPGHPSGNLHTAGSPTRHPSQSVFGSMEGGQALRKGEIKAHWQAKGQRLIRGNSGKWYDPGF